MYIVKLDGGSACTSTSSAFKAGTGWRAAGLLSQPERIAGRGMNWITQAAYSGWQKVFALCQLSQAKSREPN